MNLSKKDISKVRPLATTVFLKQYDTKNKTKSGLEYDMKSKVKLSYKGQVVSVGDDVVGLKKGDDVIYKWHQNVDVNVEGETYVFIDEEKILGVV